MAADALSATTRPAAPFEPVEVARKPRPSPSSALGRHCLEAQRIGDGTGDQRFLQSISLAVSKKTTARAN